MHTRKCKAKHHPLFVCSVCSPIKFFIGFLDPISAPLEVLVWFFFSIGIFVYLKWSRNKHQSGFIQKLLRLLKQRTKMQGGNVTVVAEVWMRLCTISIPHVKASTSRVLATSAINNRHWGLLFTAHKKTMERIQRDSHYFNPMKVIRTWEDKRDLDSIGDPYALLLAGLEERERVLRVEV